MADPKTKFDGILVPNDRIVQRGQGCWNCKHMQRAAEWWTQKRQEHLSTAARLASESILGEQREDVIRIRRMVDTIDNGVATGGLIRCGRNPRGKTALGEPVGDLVASNYLCGDWSAATGASIAREGRGPEKLPEELVEDLDGADAVRRRPLN